MLTKTKKLHEGKVQPLSKTVPLQFFAVAALVALAATACSSSDESVVDTSATDTSTSTTSDAGTGSGAMDPVVVVVIAHPDDELTTSPLLAHYAKQGADVYLVSVTSGQTGGMNTDIPVGAELGAAREAELAAAAAAYGIQPPFTIGNQDGEQDTLSDAEIAELKSKLRSIFEEVRAQVIITFGPDGFTGHADHIAVGAITTELVEEWYAEADATGAPEKLYHTMFPASFAGLLPAGQEFVSVDDAEATTIVDAGDGIAEAEAAVLAYETQFTTEAMQQAQGLYAT